MFGIFCSSCSIFFSRTSGMTEALAEESHAARTQTADNFIPGEESITQGPRQYKT